MDMNLTSHDWVSGMISLHVEFESEKAQRRQNSRTLSMLLRRGILRFLLQACSKEYLGHQRLRYNYRRRRMEGDWRVPA